MEITMNQVCATAFVQISRAVSFVHQQISTAAKMRYKLSDSVYVWYNHQTGFITKLFLLEGNIPVQAWVTEMKETGNEVSFKATPCETNLGPLGFYHNISARLSPMDLLYVESSHNFKLLEKDHG